MPNNSLIFEIEISNDLTQNIIYHLNLFNHYAFLCMYSIELT